MTRMATVAEVRVALDRARPFLEGELLTLGIWNDFAEGGTPAPCDGTRDVDTTAAVLSPQERMGWARSKSPWILQNNERGDGPFYTCANDG